MEFKKNKKLTKSKRCPTLTAKPTEKVTHVSVLVKPLYVCLSVYKSLRSKKRELVGISNFFTAILNCWMSKFIT